LARYSVGKCDLIKTLDCKNVKLYLSIKGGVKMSTEKKLTITIPEDLHFKFKMLALRKKTTMKDIILNCVEQQIQQEEETKK